MNTGSRRASLARAPSGRVWNSVTQEELGEESLLLHIERSWLRWLRLLFPTPLLVASLERCSKYMPLGGDHGEDLGVLPNEQEEVTGARKVWMSLLRTG